MDKRIELEQLIKNKEKLIPLIDAYLQGFSFADMQNITPEELENLYALAYNQYQANNYTQAESIFQTLILLDNSEIKYYMGLGACKQAQEQYDLAIEMYSNAFVLEGMINPEPLFLIAICLLKQGKRQDALDILSGAPLCGKEDNSRHMLYKSKCEQLEAVLKATQNNS